jgi:hypothetical protein
MAYYAEATAMIDATHTEWDEDGLVRGTGEHGMAYVDVDGKEQLEPACPCCIAEFSISGERKDLMLRALDFHLLAESYDVENWHAITAQYGSSDYRWQDQLGEIWSVLNKASGLYCLRLDDLRTIRGSIHLAIAAEVVQLQDRTVAVELLGWLSEFHAHLHNRHRDLSTCHIDHEILRTLDEPLYVGALNIEQAWALTSDVGGKTTEEIRDVFSRKLDGILDDVRSNVATCHGGRMNSLGVLEEGLSNAVTKILENAEKWQYRFKNTTDPADLIYLSEEIHRQVFLVDELLAMGCRNQAICGAVGSIRELIDWDECATLKQHMARAELHGARHCNNGDVDRSPPAKTNTADVQAVAINSECSKPELETSQKWAAGDN